MARSRLPLLLLLAGCTEPQPTAALDRPIPKLVAKLRRATVVIEVGDRHGEERPLGAGFVIDPNGLIATSLHVIGEARPITVQLEGREPAEVTAIHAFSRKHDLAVLRVDAAGLESLDLAREDPAQGQSVLAFGNPRGMQRSVVTGMVSALRDVDDVPMIQLAIPIEPGNSGGPVVDLGGRVHGVVTMKSRITENLGFAVRVSALRALLDHPNSVPMKDWLTIGALDDGEWSPLFGATWRQRAGRIVTERPGDGFAGRALCLHRDVPEARPYTVGVTVRLEREDGAAGLAFASDGGHVHYGFYPTRGRLRFTRFGGPEVMSWEILFDDSSEAYRPGEWNRLEVERKKRGFAAYVNRRLVFETQEDGLPDGRIGLVKFRDTRAEFKHFTLGDRPEAERDIDPKRRRAVETLARSETFDDKTKQKLLEDPEASLRALEREARRHDRRAETLRKAAQEIHTAHVRDRLKAELAKPEEQIDLLLASLLVAQLDNPDLRVDDYVAVVERMVATLQRRIPEIATEQERLELLNRYLFAENGFHGSRDEYYRRSNSYLNEVIDDREGLPLTLSILYMVLGEKIGLRIAGIGLPGHFIVQHLPRRGSGQLIDVFDGGRPMSDEEAKRLAATYGSKHPGLELSAPMPRGRIILRMLTNLGEGARRSGDMRAQLRYLDTMIAIEPDLPRARWERAQLRLRTGPAENAKEDLEWLEAHGH